MKLLITPEERAIEMKQLRPVSKAEKIVFPLMVLVSFVVIAFGYSVNWDVNVG